MKLEDLISELTNIYNQYGNLTVEIIREGVCLPEFDSYVSGNYLYLEAYEEGEGICYVK